MARTLRYLRIAWSVGWGIVAVLMIVMWVRSYWLRDLVTYANPNGLRIALGSNQGSAYLIHRSRTPEPVKVRWQYGYGPPQTFSNPLGIASISGRTKIGIPYGVLAIAFVAVATVPWLSLKRYSLRTLLIATTLIALIMGLAVYVAH